jgi:hypothetical protein
MRRTWGFTILGVCLLMLAALMLMLWLAQGLHAEPVDHSPWGARPESPRETLTESIPC